MTTDSVHPVHEEAVVLDGDQVLIRGLTADGIVAELLKQSLADGREPETVIRQALQIGAAVLLHGSNQAMVDSVAAHVERLLEALDAKADHLAWARDARERTPARGFSFEQAVGKVLDAAFGPHEDVVEATGTATGVGSDKVGDFLVTVNPRDCFGHKRCIVFEAKDRKLSMTKALAELEEAILNRGACVGVLVFGRSSQSPLVGDCPLRVFPGNRMMVVYDEESGNSLALEVAAQLARTLAIGAETEDAPVSKRVLSDRLAKLVNTVERADEIQRGIAGARRGLDQAEDAYELLREEALALIYELQDRM